jgi:aminoglycoside phosphotransferase family enzyme
VRAAYALDSALATKVACLREPQTYSERPGPILAIETHMSWVFLTRRHAYKLKKPVRHDYLDFTTLEARRHYCHEELRLNQRLADGVYLDVVPLSITEQGAMQLEAAGQPVEWLVKMRRLDRERMLDHLIRSRTLKTGELQAMGERLSAFYREALPVGMSAEDYRRRCEAGTQLNRQVLSDPLFALPPESIESIHATLLAALDRADVDPAGRAARVVEGHGDLRPEHVCLETPPVIYDRLEFNRTLRLVDPADELAFLAMECGRIGDPDTGDFLFNLYATLSGDTPSPHLRHYYMADRAFLRARLAAQHLRDCPRDAWPHWLSEAAQYLEVAAIHCRALRTPDT